MVTTKNTHPSTTAFNFIQSKLELKNSLFAPNLTGYQINSLFMPTCASKHEKVPYLSMLLTPNKTKQLLLLSFPEKQQQHHFQNNICFHSSDWASKRLLSETNLVIVFYCKATMCAEGETEEQTREQNAQLYFGVAVVFPFLF